MKIKKRVYRVQDSVEIVDPQVFVRYPMSKSVTFGEIRDKYGAELSDGLTELANKFKYPDPFNQGAFLDQESDDWLVTPIISAHDYILKQMAFSYMLNKRFGGNQRTIHTELREDLRGKICEVVGKKTVRTGRRVPGSRAGYGEDDGCGPELRDGKSHVILRVLVETGGGFDEGLVPYSFENVWIEESRVKPVVKEFLA